MSPSIAIWKSLRSISPLKYVVPSVPNLATMVDILKLGEDTLIWVSKSLLRYNLAISELISIAYVYLVLAVKLNVVDNATPLVFDSINVPFIYR